MLKGPKQRSEVPGIETAILGSIVALKAILTSSENMRGKFISQYTNKALKAPQQTFEECFESLYMLV